MFAATAVLRLIFAAALPLTGDEAYFVVWGLHPDTGYYDHGPMTGWWLWAVLLPGRAVWLVRLPAVLVPMAVALLLRRAVRPLGAAEADGAATLFLLSPVGILGFLFTTDTPLLFFSVLAVFWAVRAARRDRVADWFVAGLFLGCAFLAKYFAVLLGLALGAALLGFGPGRRKAVSFAALAAGVLPAAALDIAWNAGHSWTHIVFNVYNRNTGAAFSPGSFAAFAALALAVAGPALAALVPQPGADGRRSWREAWARLRACGLHPFLVALAVPGALLAVVSLFQMVGAHWLIFFQPFVFPVAAACGGAGALRRSIPPSMACAAVLAGIAGLASVVPPETGFRGVLRMADALGAPSLRRSAERAWARNAGSIVLGSYTGELLAAVEPLRGGAILASPSYAQAALLGFHAGRHVPVVGPGSYHARQDDLITDFRRLDGRDVAIVTNRPEPLAEAAAWFDRLEVAEISVRGTTFAVLRGTGFRYAVYREQVLRVVAERWYRMPPWLRRLSAPCFFRSRYGFAEPAEAGSR
jgi:hypothetical protein